MKGSDRSSLTIIAAFQDEATLLNILSVRSPNLEIISLRSSYFDKNHYLHPAVQRFPKVRHLIYDFTLRAPVSQDLTISNFLWIHVSSCSQSNVFIFQIAHEILQVFDAYPSLVSILFPSQDLVFTYNRRSRTVLLNADKSLQISPRPDVCHVLDIHSSVNRELLRNFHTLRLFY